MTEMPAAITARRAARHAGNLTDEALDTILAALERIRFGSIAITLHEGKVVQLEITEKRRLAT